ncbi:MAG: hypothetical protein LBH01_04955 [Verrucomicrobiales bacterium]|jgi:hypothetical protein|nr:hypothetical protein [Verrucomicrobiales bacterium]
MTLLPLRRRKGSPVPITFDPEEDLFIREICENTGLSKADLIRRACRYSLSRFLSQEVSPIDPSLRRKK